MSNLLKSLTALCVANLTFASFPITQSTLEPVTVQTDQIDNISTTTTNVSNGGSGWGIAALACGIVGLFAGALIMGPLAIVFGALGLKKKLRGLAIAGLILGIIELLIIRLLIGIILAVV